VQRRYRDGRRQKLVRRSRTGRCRGAPSLLIRGGSPCETCGGVEGVRRVPGSPASKNFTMDRGLTGAIRARFKRP
jgi:hypothetical protein